MIANAGRSDNLARARELLHVAPALPKTDDASDEPVQPTFVCPDCGAAMIVIETMARKHNDSRTTQASRRTMNADANHPSTHHRAEPMREAVVLRCKNPVYGSPPQREITGIGFATMHLKHLSDIFVSQSGTIVMSNGRATIQIPIGHRVA